MTTKRRTWEQVREIMMQEIDRYEEEKAKLETRIDRLGSSLNLRRGNYIRLRHQYHDEMHEALERYNAAWDNCDFLYYLCHEPEALVGNGYKVSSPQDLGYIDSRPEG